MTAELIHISNFNVYRFKSITFEWHQYCGPTFLRRKDLEMKRALTRPMREYGLLGQWLQLSREEREQFRI